MKYLIKILTIIIISLLLSYITSYELISDMNNYEYKIRAIKTNNKQTTFVLNDKKRKPRLYLNKTTNSLYMLSKCNCDTILISDNIKSIKLIKQYKNIKTH